MRAKRVVISQVLGFVWVSRVRNMIMNTHGTLNELPVKRTATCPACCSVVLDWPQGCRRWWNLIQFDFVCEEFSE